MTTRLVYLPCWSALVVLLTLVIANANSEEINFLASVSHEGEVQLRWSCPEWKETWRGFAIFRSVAAGDREMAKRVSAGPIFADFRVESLKRRGLVEVLERRDDFKIEDPSPEFILNIYKTNPEAFENIQGVIWKHDAFQWALAFGFGFVDKSSEAGKEYTYYLHALNADGLLEEPLAERTIICEYGRFSFPTEARLEVNWTAPPRPQPQVTIELPQRSVHDGRIRYVQILRADTQSSPAVDEVARIPLPMFERDGAVIRFSVLDNDAKHLSSPKYAVVPVDAFGRSGVIGPRAVLSSDYTHQGEAPENLRAAIVDGAVVLTWNAEGLDELIAGFHVNRWIVNERTDTVITREPLSRGARTYVDRDLNGMEGKTILYRILRAVSDNVHSSPQSNSVRIHIPRPHDSNKANHSYPKKLSYEYIVGGDDEGKVRLYWAHEEEREPIRYELLWSDSSFGSWDVLTEVENTGEAVVTLPMNDGKEIHILVAARIDNASPPEPIGLVVSKRPSAPSLWLESDPGRIRASWRALGQPTLLGYRVYNGEDLLLGENVLTKYRCHADLFHLPPGDYRINVRAVNAVGMESASSNIHELMIEAKVEELPPEIGSGELRIFTRPFPGEPGTVRDRFEGILLEDGTVKRHGFFEAYKRNGDIFVKGTFKDGERHGVLSIRTETETVYHLYVEGKRIMSLDAFLEDIDEDHRPEPKLIDEIRASQEAK